MVENFENGQKINVQKRFCQDRIIFGLVENTILDHNAAIFIFYSKILLP